MAQNKRVEQIKSGLLALLVILSVVLSFALWYRLPVDETLDSSGNVGGTAWGPGKTVNQVLQPVRLVIHRGENRHTLALPDTSLYSQAVELLRQMTVFHLDSRDWSGEDWQKIVQGQCIEYAYGLEMNGSVLSRIVSFADRPDNQMRVNTLYLYQDQGGWHLIFKGEQQAYEARGEVSAKAWQEVMRQSAPLPLFRLYGGEKQAYYLPVERMKLSTNTYEKEELNSVQLMSSFFVDPSLTRRITERNGSEILTDGNRGVQYDSLAKRIDYTDPGASWQTGVPAKEQPLDKAVQFVNEHGGMSGFYLVTENAEGENGTIEYAFRSYCNGWPLHDPSFTIRVRMQGNAVQEMIRSIVYLGPPLKKENIVALSGDELLSHLRAQGVTPAMVSSISLTYMPEDGGNGTLQLHPLWRVERTNADVFYLDAVTGEIWKGKGD